MATSTTSGTPAAPSTSVGSSGGNDNLAYLKSLVNQLQAKIQVLEDQASAKTHEAGTKLTEVVNSVKDTASNAVQGAKAAVTTGSSPAQQLRFVRPFFVLSARLTEMIELCSWARLEVVHSA